MKLSQLVAYRNYLEQTSALQVGKAADQDLGQIMHMVQTNSVQIDQFVDQLKTQQEIIQKNFEGFEQLLDQLRHQIKELIAQQEPAWFVESYRLYEQEMCHESAEYILKRHSPISTESRISLQTRLLNYTDWQHAGMVIRPGLETFIYDMVSFDPLYIIDESYELLEPTIVKFPAQYQRRLRPYVVNERQTDPMMIKIPDGQFGMCLVYHLFNFRPLEIIKRYLIEIFQKLKPGGVLIMTFNDCDREKAVMLVEQHFACYTPGYLVKDLVISLGYEILYSWHDGGPSTWLELRKPGTLTTLKGGQSFAKVVAYPN
jgi:SAM-dependent methyltransferase